jgi:hypothetical protein
MKSNSDLRPPVLLDLGDGSYHYNYNVKEIAATTENGELKTSFEYDTVHIWGNPTYEELVPAVIAEQYNPSKETSLINKYNAYILELSTNEEYKTEYQEYLKKTFEIKEMVKNDLQECFTHHFNQ